MPDIIKEQGDTEMIYFIKLRVKITIEPDEDGFYAYCPELPGIHVDGVSVEDAVSNARDAAGAYFTSLLRNGEPLPLCAQAYSLKDILLHYLSPLLPRKNKPIVKIEDLDVRLAVA